MKRLYGSICATVTPMYPDGSVDLESAKALYRYLTDNGVHCLYPNGTNGESLSLTSKERMQIAEACMQESHKAAVVYIQCGAATVEETYAHVLHAQRIGADGAGLMTPVFFPVDDAGMEEYYSHALKMINGFPLYVYNIPSRTGNDISSALFTRLVRSFPNLMGIKYSSPDLIRLNEYIHAAEDRDIDALIGCDKLALCCLVLGGKGFVSGPCAAFPSLYVSLYHSFLAKDITTSMVLQREITQKLELMQGMPEIPAIKYLLMKKGIIACDTCRAPLRALTSNEKEKLDALI